MKSQLNLLVIIVLLTLSFFHFTLAMRIGDDSEMQFRADNVPRMYLNTERPALTNGSVTSINYCYYGPGLNVILASTYQALVAIFRPFNGSRNYRRISNTITLTKQTSLTDLLPGFDCDTYQLEQSVQVLEGDVIGACLDEISGTMPLSLVSRSDEFGYFMRLTDADNIPCGDGVLPEVIDDLSNSGRRRILHVFADINNMTISTTTSTTTETNQQSFDSSTTSTITETSQQSFNSALIIKVGSSVGVILLIVHIVMIIIIIVLIRRRKRKTKYSDRTIPHEHSSSNLIGDYRSQTFHAAEFDYHPQRLSCHYERVADALSQQTMLSIGDRSTRELAARRMPRDNYLTSQNSHYEMQVFSTSSNNTYHFYSTLEGPNCPYVDLLKMNITEDIYADVSQYVQPAKAKVDVYAQIKSHGIQNIDRSSIQISGHLGSGQFGRVEQGVLRVENCDIHVALKTLNNSATDDGQLKFLQEVAIMAQFRHPNVILLYGIVCKSEPITMVAELVEKGDLQKYLMTLRPRPDEVPDSDLPSLLLSFSQQVALGMHYLSSKGFVHRDLAARNILVSKDNMCKIADFGLSRDLADEEYYISNGGIIPIKWTAPEALHYKKYCTASDVWSYGCLLYEIWSLGHKPYETLSNMQAVRFVNKGKRLAPPPGCPELIYDLMIQCWNPTKSERPNFRTIHLNLLDNGRNVLSIPQESLDTHHLAGVLGAPLTAGERMFMDLQTRYEEIAYYDII